MEDLSVRGVKSYWYYTLRYSGFFIGIPTESDKKNCILKDQPVSDDQFKILEAQKRID